MYSTDLRMVDKLIDRFVADAMTGMIHPQASSNLFGGPSLLQFGNDISLDDRALQTRSFTGLVLPPFCPFLSHISPVASIYRRAVTAQFPADRASVSA